MGLPFGKVFFSDLFDFFSDIGLFVLVGGGGGVGGAESDGGVGFGFVIFELLD